MKFFLILLYILLLFIFPSIKIGNGLPEIRIDDIVLVLLLILSKDVFSRKLNVEISILLIIFFIIISLSVNISDISLNDIFIIFYFIRLAILKTVIDKNRALFFNYKKTINQFVFLGVLINLIASLFEYFNLFNFNESYSPLFTNSQLDSLNNANFIFRRAIGTFSNPNVFSEFLVISYIFLDQNISKNKYKIILFLLVNAGLVFSASRLGFICFFIYNIFNYVVLKFNLKTLIIFLGVGLCAFYLLEDNLYLLNRIESISEINSESTYTSRTTIKWPYYLQVGLENFFTGVGSSKDEYLKKFEAVDSEIIELFMSHGIFLILAYFIFLIKSCFNFAYKNYIQFIIIFIIAFSYALSATLFLEFRIGAILILFSNINIISDSSLTHT